MQPGFLGDPVDDLVYDPAVSEATYHELLGFADLNAALDLEDLDVEGLDDAVMGSPMPSFPHHNRDVLEHQQRSAGAVSNWSADHGANPPGSSLVQQQQQQQQQ